MSERLVDDARRVLLPERGHEQDVHGPEEPIGVDRAEERYVGTSQSANQLALVCGGIRLPADRELPRVPWDHGESPDGTLEALARQEPAQVSDPQGAVSIPGPAVHAGGLRGARSGPFWFGLVVDDATHRRVREVSASGVRVKDVAAHADDSVHVRREAPPREGVEVATVALPLAVPTPSEHRGPRAHQVVIVDGMDKWEPE